MAEAADHREEIDAPGDARGKPGIDDRLLRISQHDVGALGPEQRDQRPQCGEVGASVDRGAAHRHDPVADAARRQLLLDLGVGLGRDRNHPVPGGCHVCEQLAAEIDQRPRQAGDDDDGLRPLGPAGHAASTLAGSAPAATRAYSSV